MMRKAFELYDRMQRTMETGEAFVSDLDPPPGDPRAAQPNCGPGPKGRQ